jgi:ABC-2 type transport system permease protein
MGNIFLIIWREYLTRIRKRSFILMTILGPVLFTTLLVMPMILAYMEKQGQQKIAVIEFDQNLNPVPRDQMKFIGAVKSTKNIKFDYLGETELSQIKPILENTDYFGVLVLYHEMINTNTGKIDLYCKKLPSDALEMYITQSINRYVHDLKLDKFAISESLIKSLDTNIKLTAIKVENGEKINKELRDIQQGVGYVFAFVIYMFILFFGSQVMRGVVEEKTNRIVEIMVTSVKPFHLMIGKITGIGMVGLTQFLVWIILTFAIFQGVSSKTEAGNMKEMKQQMTHTELFSAPTANSSQEIPVTEHKLEDVMKIAGQLNFPVLLISFAFFFITGYLLYAGMFAAIGSAVDTETDTQQFMLPVTMPLIIAIVVMFNAIMNPEGQIATIFTYIPFTAPIIAMARIPFVGINAEILISAFILILSFLLMTWIAAKIYRTGILMYGKKITFREIFKWVRYKN